MAYSFHTDNGILAKVPGPSTAAGIAMLPKPGPGCPERLTATVDADWVGRVEITYALTQYRHNKSPFWGWTATYAREAPPQE